MPKYSQSAAQGDAGRRQPRAFQEVCVPLYLPAQEAWQLTAPRQIDAEDLVVDASGITIGDEDDDDVY